jgi:thiol-disulfide isomerase/thioredoxin
LQVRVLPGAPGHKARQAAAACPPSWNREIPHGAAGAAFWRFPCAMVGRNVRPAMRIKSLFTFATSILATALLAQAADEASLKPGATAPALKASAWVKGNAIEKFKPGTVYVVEFWATWCGPCKTTIPHLTEMAKKFKGKVEFIGMDVWEREPEAAKLKEKVVKFVEDMGAKMDYNIALDTEDSFMANEWMKAAGRTGIPSAFVVDQAGKIAWVGHPMDGMESVIEEVLAGKFDVKAAAEKEAQKQAAQKKEQEMARTISRLRSEGKAAEALAEFDKAAKENPELAKRGAMMRVSLVLESDPAAGAKAIKTLSEGEYKDNPRALMSLARMVGGPQAKQPDYELALSLAQQAIKTSKEPDAMLSMALADIYSAKGDTEKAIAAMKECLALVEKDKEMPPTFVKSIRERLAKLESGK